MRLPKNIFLCEKGKDGSTLVDGGCEAFRAHRQPRFRAAVAVADRPVGDTMTA